MAQKEKIKKFQETVFDFYHKNRRDFPWRQTQNPYHILVSEIMLQQTQADRVERYYEKFIQKFPNVAALAKANFKDIYEVWQGLGYNRRAMYLKKTAEVIIEEYQGKFPKTVEELEQLPGIGPYTARAVSIFSFNAPLACIETNIRRVFIHHFFAKAEKVTDSQILELAEWVLDKNNSREWNWALMDYGAYLKSQVENPNRRHKNYAIQSKFEGSIRQIRGAILRILSAESKSLAELMHIMKKEPDTVEKVLLSLKKEGLIMQNKKIYSLT